MSPSAATDPLPLAAACSLEYLLGFELRHERHGTGCVVAVDDERETCRVRFAGDVEVELDGTSLGTLGLPWQIDIKELSARHLAYSEEIAALTKQIQALQREADALEETLRRGENLQPLLGLSPAASIVLRRDRTRALH
jgi:hypothetical protein